MYPIAVHGQIKYTPASLFIAISFVFNNSDPSRGHAVNPIALYLHLILARQAQAGGSVIRSYTGLFWFFNKGKSENSSNTEILNVYLYFNYHVIMFCFFF